MTGMFKLRLAAQGRSPVPASRAEQTISGEHYDYKGSPLPWAEERSNLQRQKGATIINIINVTGQWTQQAVWLSEQLEFKIGVWISRVKGGEVVN